MAGNNLPIFTRVGAAQFFKTDGDGGSAGALKTANNNYDGTTGTYLTVFTSDTTNGSYVEKIRCKAAGANIQSLLRVFIFDNPNSKGILFDEVILPATSASATAPQPTVDIPIKMALPPNFTIKVAIATTVAAGWYISVWGGTY